MFDILLIFYLIVGAIFGYWRGFSSSIIIMLVTYLPMLGFAYYYDQISGFVQITIANTQDASTAAIGGLGAFSGIIAIIGFSVATILGTRIIIKLLSIEKPELTSRILGAAAGTLSHNIMATLAFFFLFTAVPAVTSDVVRGSKWLMVMRPIHQLSYPPYLALLEERTQKLSLNVAEKGLAATLVGGVDISDLGSSLGFEDANFSSALNDIKALAKTINIEEIRALSNEYSSDNLTAADIDRMIQQEQAERLRLIEQQLR